MEKRIPSTNEIEAWRLNFEAAQSVIDNKLKCLTSAISVHMTTPIIDRGSVVALAQEYYDFITKQDKAQQ